MVMDYNDMSSLELKTELVKRGLSSGGYKDDLRDRLVTNDHSKFEKFGPLNDRDGSNRSVLIQVRSEEAAKCTEARCWAQIFRAERMKGAELERIRRMVKQEVAALMQRIVV